MWGWKPGATRCSNRWRSKGKDGVGPFVKGRVEATVAFLRPQAVWKVFPKPQRSLRTFLMGGFAGGAKGEEALGIPTWIGAGFSSG